VQEAVRGEVQDWKEQVREGGSSCIEEQWVQFEHRA
jgi:hypothetical protein